MLTMLCGALRNLGCAAGRWILLRLLIAAVFLLIGLGAALCVVQSTEAQTATFEDTFDYTIPVVVSNTGSSDLSGEWIPIQNFPYSKLSTGGFIDHHAAFGASPGASTPGFGPASSTAGNVAWWIQPKSLEASSSATEYIFMGGEQASTETAFPLDSRLNVTVPQHASQTITSGALSLTADVDLSNAADGWLINKPGSYGLGVKAGVLYGYALGDQSSYRNSERRYPFHSVANAWILTGCTVAYACVNSSDVTTYVSSPRGNNASGVWLRVSPPALALGESITGFEVNVRGRASTSAYTNDYIGIHYYSDLNKIAEGQIRYGFSTRRQTKSATFTSYSGGTTDIRIVAQNTRQRVVEMYVRFRIRSAGGLAEVTAPIPTGRAKIKLEHNASGNLVLSVDDTEAASANVGSTIAVSTSQSVAIGSGDLRGALYGVQISDAGVDVLDLELEPSGLVQTNNGSSDGSWGGTIDDESASNVPVTYSITRSTTNLGTTFGEMEYRYRDDAGAARGTGGATGGEVEGAINEAGGADESGNLVSFILDPIREALGLSPFGVEGGGLIVMIMLSVGWTGFAYRMKAQPAIAAGVSIAIYALGAALGFYGEWIVIVYAVWAVSLTIFMHKGVRLGRSDMPSWVGTFAVAGIVIAIFDAMYAGTTDVTDAVTSVDTVAQFALFRDTEVGLFGFGFALPLPNFGFITALLDVLTPSFSQFFPGSWRIVGLVFQTAFGAMMAVMLIRWVAPIASAVTNSIRR